MVDKSRSDVSENDRIRRSMMRAVKRWYGKRISVKGKIEKRLERQYVDVYFRKKVPLCMLRILILEGVFYVQIMVAGYQKDQKKKLYILSEFQAISRTFWISW